VARNLGAIACLGAWDEPSFNNAPEKKNPQRGRGGGGGNENSAHFGTPPIFIFITLSHSVMLQVEKRMRQAAIRNHAGNLHSLIFVRVKRMTDNRPLGFIEGMDDLVQQQTLPQIRRILFAILVRRLFHRKPHRNNLGPIDGSFSR